MREGVAITLFPWRGRFRRLGRLWRPRLAAEPVAVALEVIDLPVVEQPIDQGGGEGGVVEHPAPLGQTLVRGDDRRFLLVPGGDQPLEDLQPAAARIPARALPSSR